MPIDRRRRRPAQVILMPTVELSPVDTDITHDDIARRAFEIYCERGQTDGHDLEDWLAAERELLTDASRSTAA